MFVSYPSKPTPLFCAVALLLFGCQTVVLPPSEFPTINTEKDLHIVVRMNDEGDSVSLHYQIEKALLEAFEELKYPGEVVIHISPQKVEDSLQKVTRFGRCA